MGGGYLRTDARGAVGDDGIEKSYDVDAFFQQAGCHFLGQPGVAQHHGYDGVSAWSDG